MMKNLLKIFMLVTILFSPLDLFVNSEEVEKINEEIAAADTPDTGEIVDTNEEVSNDESEVALADSDDIPAVSASVIEDINTLNTIENISIDVENGVGIVTITTSFSASYEEIDKQSNKYSLKLTNVILDDRLQVARDLSDFVLLPASSIATPFHRVGRG